MERHQDPLPVRGEPRLLDRVPPRHPADALQRPDSAGSVDGIRRFMLLRREWHPEGVAVERGAFLSDLADKSNVASSIRNHAPNAIVFYRQILEKGIRLAGRYRSCEEAGQATDRAHARRPAGGPGALGRRFGQDPL